MDYSRFISEFSNRRKPSLIRAIGNMKSVCPPDVVYMVGGIPCVESVPISEISFKLQDGSQITLDNNSKIKALQYGPTEGYPPLLKYLEDFVAKYFSPPRWQDSKVFVTPGSQFGIYSAIASILNVNDYFVISEPVYATVFNVLDSYSPRILSVQSDSKGMIPDHLREVLSKWDSAEIRDKKEGVPKVMYVNPNGGNPTGVSMPEERKREIYKIASEYNLIILEDDPYYLIQFKDFKDYAPTFLSMDVDGRVLRFDSFSKFLSSGMRLGFATGPKPLIQRIVLQTEVSILHASTLSMVMAYEILNYWGEAGFLNHVAKLRKIYTRRRDVLVTAAQKYLTGLCEWDEPEGGMFLWIKVPKLENTYDMILERGVNRKILAVPGSGFSYHSDKFHNYLRVNYAFPSDEDMVKGIQNLAQLIREEILIEGKLNGKTVNGCSDSSVNTILRP